MSSRLGHPGLTVTPVSGQRCGLGLRYRPTPFRGAYGHRIANGPWRSLRFACALGGGAHHRDHDLADVDVVCASGSRVRRASASPGVSSAASTLCSTVAATARTRSRVRCSSGVKVRIPGVVVQLGDGFVAGSGVGAARFPEAARGLWVVRDVKKSGHDPSRVRSISCALAHQSSVFPVFCPTYWLILDRKPVIARSICPTYFVISQPWGFAFARCRSGLVLRPRLDAEGYKGRQDMEAHVMKRIVR